MNNMRIEITNEEELKDIKLGLELAFNIDKESRLYKKRNEEGYYIYLEVSKKEIIKTGRKERFTDQEKEMIRMYRFQGQTITELAKSFNCSRGLIHKVINT